MALVREYSGMGFYEQLNEIDCLDWMALRRDAYIDAMGKTEKGRESLHNAWLMKQTKLDRVGLRDLVAHEKSGGE